MKYFKIMFLIGFCIESYLSAQLADNLDSTRNFNSGFNGTRAAANGDGTGTLSRTRSDIDAGIDWMQGGNQFLSLVGESLLAITPAASIHDGLWNVDLLSRPFLTEEHALKDTLSLSPQSLDVTQFAADRGVLPTATQYFEDMHINPSAYSGSEPGFAITEIEAVPEPSVIALFCTAIPLLWVALKFNRRLPKQMVMMTNRFTFLGLMAALLAFRSHAETLPTGFYSANPMLLAYPDSTWSKPVNQSKFFPNGRSFGREVPSIGGAGRLGLSLDISGNNAPFTARPLPANQSPFAQVLLFDTDGTIDRFGFFSSSTHASTFSSAPIIFSGVTIATAGSTTGLEFSDIVAYETQGGSFGPDSTADAPFDLKSLGFNGINNPIPEPGTVALVGMGLSMIGLWQRFKARGKK
jgi:PEP-CTERM motif